MPVVDEFEGQRDYMLDQVLLWLGGKFGVVSEHELAGLSLSQLHAAMRMEDDCQQCLSPEDCPHSKAYLRVYQTSQRGFREFAVGAVVCERASAMLSAKAAEAGKKDAFALSRIPRDCAGWTFDKYDTNGHDRLMMAKYKAQDYSDRGLGLIIGGDRGAGKTHLAIASAIRAMERGRSVLFYSVPELLNELRPNSINSDDVLARAKAVDLLVLDDAGKQKDSDWTDEKLFMIIDHRYLHKLPVIVTTNAVGVKQLETLLGDAGAPLVSRLAESSGQIWLTNVPDYRVAYKKPQQMELLKEAS